ncbi:MAG: PVC-type heme-binding CxxCH protein, partial [Planctomycetaceae bacterium]
LLYAEDTDGDGRADTREVLYSGFVESNPQHRINGFAYGLDNWLYLGSGASSGNVTSHRTGETINMSGRDLRIRPDTGEFDAESGRTQYGRGRDDWGNWFGNTNSNPLFHFVISDRYLRRNRDVAAPDPKVHLLTPPGAPPVFPSSRTVDRFNDLHAANRFTSACGPAVFRDPSLGESMYGSGFICEPVHNLVHRTIIEPNGVTFRGRRHESEQQSEFLSSTDTWFRPVRVQTGPDGALWVADMYRQVIEHPEWIPLDWQAKLDLRAGADKGRIYRVYRKGRRPGPLPNLADLSTAELVKRLSSQNGPTRDLAQQLLVQRGDETVVPALKELATSGDTPLPRIHALGTLDGLNALDAKLLSELLRRADARVLPFAIRCCEPFLPEHPELGEALVELAEHEDLRVRFQLALSLGEWNDPRAGDALGQLALRDAGDEWMRAAILSSA